MNEQEPQVPLQPPLIEAHVAYDVSRNEFYISPDRMSLVLNAALIGQLISNRDALAEEAVDISDRLRPCRLGLIVEGKAEPYVVAGLLAMENSYTRKYGVNHPETQSVRELHKQFESEKVEGSRGYLRGMEIRRKLSNEE